MLTDLRKTSSLTSRTVHVSRLPLLQPQRRSPAQAQASTSSRAVLSPQQLDELDRALADSEPEVHLLSLQHARTQACIHPPPLSTHTGSEASDEVQRARDPSVFWCGTPGRRTQGAVQLGRIALESDRHSKASFSNGCQPELCPAPAAGESTPCADRKTSSIRIWKDVYLH